MKNLNISVRCPKCNKTSVFELDQKNFKANNSPISLKDVPMLNNGNINPDLTLIAFNECAHSFLVSNRKLIPYSPEINLETDGYQTKTGYDLIPADSNNILLAIGIAQGKMNAIKFYKSFSGLNLKESKEYVEKILSENNIKTKEGCFIATACFGDYDAKEVVILRLYRDHVLMKSRIGRRVIHLYYLISPYLAGKIAKSETAKLLIRKLILNRLIKKIKNKIPTESTPLSLAD